MLSLNHSFISFKIRIGIGISDINNIKNKEKHSWQSFLIFSLRQQLQLFLSLELQMQCSASVSVRNQHLRKTSMSTNILEFGTNKSETEASHSNLVTANKPNTPWEKTDGLLFTTLSTIRVKLTTSRALLIAKVLSAELASSCLIMEIIASLTLITQITLSSIRAHNPSSSSRLSTSGFWLVTQPLTLLLWRQLRM